MKITGNSVSPAGEKLRNLVLPGFDGIPINHVITFVIKGFQIGRAHV